MQWLQTAVCSSQSDPVFHVLIIKNSTTACVAEVLYQIVPLAWIGVLLSLSLVQAAICRGLVISITWLQTFAPFYSLSFKCRHVHNTLFGKLCLLFWRLKVKTPIEKWEFVQLSSLLLVLNCETLLYDLYMYLFFFFCHFIEQKLRLS